MSYYDNYVRRCVKPSVEHKRSMQQLVNYAFDNASTYWPFIEEEHRFGSLDFHKIEARITTLVDAKTGQKINDDFRKIIFKNCDYQPRIGTRYRFEDNIWVVYSTDNILTATSGAYIRRCNNTINTQDTYNNIHKEPCWIDYTVSNVQPDYNTQIDIPGGTLYVKCQDNEWSNSLEVNSRMLFNGVAYKVIEKHHFEQMKTNKPNSTGIITFYVKNDDLSPDDNLQLSVANYKPHTYQIICPESLVGLVNDQGDITYSVTLDGQVVEETIDFASSNESVLTINANGHYTLLALGTANITLSMHNNPTVTKAIAVEVKASVTPTYKTIIIPSHIVENTLCDEIKLNDTQVYEIYEEQNGVKNATTFTATTTGVTQKCYKLVRIDGNHFSITNNKSSDGILYVTFINSRSQESSTLEITLGGLY